MNTSVYFKRYLISVLLVVAMLRFIRVANDIVTFRRMEKNDAFITAQYVFEDGYWFKMYMRPTFIWGGFWMKELFVIDSNGEQYKQIWDSYYGELFVAWNNAMVRHLHGTYSRPLDRLIKSIGVGGNGPILGAHSPYWLLVVDVVLALILVGILSLVRKLRNAFPWRRRRN